MSLFLSWGTTGKGKRCLFTKTTYAYLLNRVAAHWISEIFLRILEPTVESGSFLCKQQEQVLHLEKKKKRQRSLLVPRLRTCDEFLSKDDGNTTEITRKLANKKTPSCTDPVHVEVVLFESWSLPTAAPT